MMILHTTSMINCRRVGHDYALRIRDVREPIAIQFLRFPRGDVAHKILRLGRSIGGGEHRVRAGDFAGGLQVLLGRRAGVLGRRAGSLVFDHGGRDRALGSRMLVVLRRRRCSCGPQRRRRSGNGGRDRGRYYRGRAWCGQSDQGIARRRCGGCWDGGSSWRCGAAWRSCCCPGWLLGRRGASARNFSPGSRRARTGSEGIFHRRTHCRGPTANRSPHAGRRRAEWASVNRAARIPHTRIYGGVYRAARRAVVVVRPNDFVYRTSRNGVCSVRRGDHSVWQRTPRMMIDAHSAPNSPRERPMPNTPDVSPYDTTRTTRCTTTRGTEVQARRPFLGRSRRVLARADPFVQHRAR